MCQVSGLAVVSKNTVFQELDLFPFAGEGVVHLLRMTVSVTLSQIVISPFFQLVLVIN